MPHFRTTHLNRAKVVMYELNLLVVHKTISPKGSDYQSCTSGDEDSLRWQLYKLAILLIQLLSTRLVLPYVHFYCFAFYLPVLVQVASSNNF